MTVRPIVSSKASHATRDGDGVKIQRIAGFHQHLMDPFLMLDELKADESKDYIGGFPPHPHRGIETLTYMLHGHFRHQDHLGNVGELRDGGAQWMSAGRGIIHSELPIATDGAMHGFQLWINLPAAKKMQAADYRDFQPETIPSITLGDKLQAKLIAGSLAGQQGPLANPAVPMLLADVHGDGALTLPVNASFKAMAYIYQGQVSHAGVSYSRGNMLFFGEGDEINLDLENAGLLLLAGEPIAERVVHWGPFVMNTQQEIDQAVKDYQDGVLTEV